MKIGIYDPYLDDTGGGEKYMMTIAQCLSKDNDITVFWDNKEDLIKVADRFSLDFSKVKFSHNIFSSRTGFLKRAFETRSYDILIILSDGSIPIVFSKKLFIHFQQPIPNSKISFKTKLKIKKISKVFCNSYFTKDFIDKSFGVNSEVIYPPVYFNIKAIKKENIILHVGRFRTQGSSDFKKQQVMIDAFKKMIDKGFKGWEFVLAVSVKDEDKNTFEKIVNSAKSYPIKFFINKSNIDLWTLYSKAKVYWHASGFGEDLEKHPEFAEHFGISTVEAMGAGAVPVVFNGGGQKEIVEDSISGFLWNSMEELESKTLMLTKDNKTLEELSKGAIKRAKVFSGNRFCSEITTLIQND